MRTTIAFVIILTIVAFATMSEFDNIKLRRDPAIILPAGDTISNPTKGVVSFQRSTIRAKYIIADSNATPGDIWEVSPAFTTSSQAKKTFSIQQAINLIDSGTILVYPGIYNEKLVLKDKIAIVGTDRHNCIIRRTDDTVVVWGQNLTSFFIGNITVENVKVSNIDSLRKVFHFKNSFADSLTRPPIQIHNVTAFVEDGDESTIVYADTSSVLVLDSYFNTGGDDSRMFTLARSSIIHTMYSFYTGPVLPQVTMVDGRSGIPRIYMAYNNINFSTFESSGTTVNPRIFAWMNCCIDTTGYVFNLNNATATMPYWLNNYGN